MIQFSLFAWTHVALLCVVTQSYLIIQNMFEGLIWFIMPIMMVIINDIMAYMFGFTMGRTPLIQLSPKKTWEGFIGGFHLLHFLLHHILALLHILHRLPLHLPGGGLATVVMSLGLAHYMCQVSWGQSYLPTLGLAWGDSHPWPGAVPGVPDRVQRRAGENDHELRALPPLPPGQARPSPDPGPVQSSPVPALTLALALAQSSPVPALTLALTLILTLTLTLQAAELERQAALREGKIKKMRR